MAIVVQNPSSGVAPAFVVAALWITSCSLAPPAAGVACTPGDYHAEIVSGGRDRQYRLHVPTTYDPNEPAALLLGFHGAGSNAAQFEGYSGFSALSDRLGFIVAYPQALGDHPTWNTTAGEHNPDVQLARDLIETVSARCSIDARRVYAAGHSNGGGMANRLGCNLAETIAAVGSVSGAYQWSEECEPGHPVAVIAVHGDRDPIIPYNGLPPGIGPPEVHFAIGVPVPHWAGTWAARNGCAAAPVDVRSGERLTLRQWDACRAGGDVVLYTIHDGGHGWPVTFDAAQLLWDFLDKYAN